MKFQKLLITLIFSVIYTLSFAQADGCGTDQSDAFMESIRENKKSFEATRNKSRVERFIPIQFHNVASTQGEGRVNDKDILKALCLLNERYIDTEMRFYSVGINYLDNTNVNNTPGGNQARTAMGNAKNDAALNVFIVTDAGTGVAGYYTRNLDIVVVRKNVLSDDRYTLEHELGHFFSLAHTHRGWDQIANGPGVEQGGYDPMIHGDTVTITSVSSSQSGSTLIELMDMSNCTIAADEICDTPPDYGFGFSCSCCRMVYDVWDLNGDKIEPMIDNVMSYSDGCNPYRFSEGQVTAMLTDFDSNRRAYLRTNEVDQYTPITEEATILSPPGQDWEEFNGVLFDWEDVPNAESYLVKIDGALNEQFITTESELYLENLEANATYFWFVTPVGKFGASCGAEDVRIFTTGSGTTSLDEIENITNYSISPNPSTIGNDISVFLTAEIKMDAAVSIIDISGKTVWTQNESLNNGTNKITVETAALRSGLYILQIETEAGKITDKLLIK